MDPNKPTEEELKKIKEEKKNELLNNKDLSKEEKQKLRKLKKAEDKKRKKELAKKKAQEKKQDEKQGKKEKNKKEPKAMGDFGKPKKNTPARRERIDSTYDLPSGMDNVTVTIDEIMNEYYGKLHSEVINLGLKLVSEKIDDASLRCLAILRAIIKFVKDYQLDERKRIEEDFPKRIKQIADFLKRCKPFTAGIEFAIEQIHASFNNVFKQTEEEARTNKYSFEKKLELIKDSMVEEIKTFAKMRIILRILGIECMIS